MTEYKHINNLIKALNDAGIQTQIHTEQFYSSKDRSEIRTELTIECLNYFANYEIIEFTFDLSTGELR